MLTVWSLACCLAKVRIPDCLPDKLLSHHTSSVLYNRYMGGVDRGNQLQQYCSVRTKSHKMYKYIFWFIFDVTITNAYVLYQFIPQMDRKNLAIERILDKDCKEIDRQLNSRKQVGRPRQMPLPRISAGIQTLSHFPRKIQKGHYRKCHAGYTTWYCNECAIRLCHSGTDSDCFMLYHIEK